MIYFKLIEKMEVRYLLDVIFYIYVIIKMVFEMYNQLFFSNRYVLLKMGSVFFNQSLGSSVSKCVLYNNGMVVFFGLRKIVIFKIDFKVRKKIKYK